MSRRLMKALEDLSVAYDGSVRNASGGVVQMRYGDDGMDPAHMEAGDGLPLSFEKLFATCQVSGTLIECPLQCPLQCRSDQPLAAALLHRATCMTYVSPSQCH